MKKLFGYFFGVIGFVVFLMMEPPEGLSSEGQATLAVAFLMACFWMTEAIHLAATALLPLALFPLLQVMPMESVAARYADPNIYLFLGGFLMAMSMQKCHLHYRIAYWALSFLGQNVKHLILGFMVISATFSMWISNTATAVMLLPIALAITSLIEKQISEERAKPIVGAFMLSIAYAASIGGTATLVGTPPNIILAGQYRSLFPELPPITFLQWMLFALPTALGLLFIAALLLTKQASGSNIAVGKESIREEQLALGPLSRAEICVMLIFFSTAICWMTRQDLQIGQATLPGWQTRLGLNGIHDGTVAIAAALLLFLTPTSIREKSFLLEWEEAKKLPWDILLLFGGGFALSAAFHSSGLSLWIGHQLAILKGMPEAFIIFGTSTSVSFLTELTSNTAAAATLLPILGSLAVSLDISPLLFMIPVALSTSYAFMLPVATPPNAILFGSGKIPLRQMIRIGVILNLLGAIWVTLMVVTLGKWVFMIQ